MKAQTRSGAELVVHALETAGVDTVFGIPGVHTLALYDALPKSGIRHVLARHEQGIGFMADGYARATGKTGVAFVITGPGVTNIATALDRRTRTPRRYWSSRPIIRGRQSMACVARSTTSRISSASSAPSPSRRCGSMPHAMQRTPCSAHLRLPRPIVRSRWRSSSRSMFSTSRQMLRRVASFRPHVDGSPIKWLSTRRSNG